MEKTYRRLPFDIELAKKIQSGEVKGRIVTEEGETVRILCFNREHYCSILALRKVPNEYGESLLCAELNTGRYHQQESEDKEDKDKFLFIELPETPKHEFKVGDKIRVNYPDNMESIIKGNYQGKILTISHVTENFVWAGSEELEELYFAPNEIEPYEEKHEFKPFDRILVKENDDDYWHPDLFGMWHGEYAECVGYNDRKYVIPYEGNEDLVGTTNNPKNYNPKN